MGRENPGVRERRIEISNLRKQIQAAEKSRNGSGGRFSEKPVNLNEIITLKRRLAELLREETGSIGKIK